MAEHPEAAASDEPIASTEDRIIDTLTLSQQEALEAAEIAGRTVFAGLTLMQAEIAEFVSERIREDLDAQNDLLRCRNLAEVREVQGRFLRRAFDQYAQETSRLMRLGGAIATGEVKPDPGA